MVAHAEEYLYTVFFPPDYPGQDAPKPEQIASAIDFTKRTGAFVTADLNTYAVRLRRQWGKPEIVDDFFCASPKFAISTRTIGSPGRTVPMSARAAI